jgi:hypothetical protein
MKLTTAGPLKMAKHIITVILWSVSDHLWDFFSGVVAGLWANVFATRALNDIVSRSAWWMWLEFTVFLASSAFGVAAGFVRRRVDEQWKRGGSHHGHEEGFLQPVIGKLTFYAVSAILFLVAGLLMILGK